ncbi:SET domain-containing protein [Hesseltinella vesiculosa]|uniref:SET domain-containing protein n=1 Tax=Hesseltinella vesiculosa TaxID=101127 RepID=A0A1X2GLW0_9FUNG|nr:SET domain-containing protein [Hesseltinella vesiculosa]
MIDTPLFVDVTNNNQSNENLKTKVDSAALGKAHLIVKELSKEVVESCGSAPASPDSALSCLPPQTSSTETAVEVATQPSQAKRRRLLSPPPSATTEPVPVTASALPALTQTNRVCQLCRATVTPIWRAGPQGKKTLCNACGLRYSKFLAGKLQQWEQPSRIVTTPKTTASSPKKSTSKQAPHSRSPTAPHKTASSSTAAPSTAVCQQGSLRDRKVFLPSGLYSGATDATAPFAFRLPLYYGDLLINEEKEFELPIDLVDDYLHGRLFDFGEQRGNKPPRYIRVISNVYTERKARKVDNGVVCQCEPPKDGQLGCGDNCLNRMMLYECNPQTCPCGNQCSNQRFRKRQFIKGLKVFKTDGRGWGLQTKQAIPQGTLITEYRGEVISLHTYQERMRTVYKYQKNFYFLDYHKGEVLDAYYKGSDARFINHGCSPNCHIEKWSRNGEFHMGVFASQDIAAHGELFYDYNFNLFDTNASGQACHCGSEKCRGYLGKRHSKK